MERFWNKVDKSGDCWLWTASINRRGYGQFKLYDRGGGKQKVVEAHRFAWLLENGAIPDGMQVCHKCDNPKCVRLDHLFIGTPKDNIRDMIQKGRDNYTGACKLTKDIARAIRYEYANGLSSIKLVAKYNISKPTILGILNGRTWKRAGGPIRDRGVRYWTNRYATGKTG